MAREIPPETSIKVTDDEFGGFRITIRYPRSQDNVVGCLILMSFAWVFLGFAGICGFAGGTSWSWHFLLYLAGWLLVGLVVVFGSLAAGLGGKAEVIMVSDDTLVVRSESGPFGSTCTFELGKVRNLRYSAAMKGVEFFADGSARLGGVDVLLNGSDPFYLGIGLPKADCLRLIRTLRDRFKIPDDSDTVEPFPVEPA